jgi:formylmethanofuran dehydrogenase subunit C
MRGGTVLIRGNAAQRAADRLRRGLIIIEGNAGPQAGSGLFAGTLIICGRAGAFPGILMRRGTIILGNPSDLSPTFIPANQVDLVFTHLLTRATAPFSEKAATCVQTANTRYSGDMAILGKGELFVSE